MQVLRTIADFRRERGALSGSLGFVPTMGYLHEGHMSLVRAAREGNEHAAVSIFVNPTQFGPNEDFSSYPRDEERDLSMLRDAGVDLVFMPSAAEMYPEGATTFVDPGPIAEVLEGKFRPGHFRGVATVVLKLFEIVRPTRAYFGRKDAQQLLVIRRMVRDLNLDVEIVPMPTLREPDGLAMSSRNVYLSPSERKQALCLYRALTLAQEMWTRGVRDAEAYRSRMREVIEAEPGAVIDYVSVAHPESLQELERIQGPALVSLAVRIGRARLIDNVTLGE
ncbi:MAG TPA: pantoate--beta-alanine ligase [Dehalococcoidia bacterium]|nr:pantoate--beta-alanine ligase [Dehalococcoidia bacterium]